jgi:hypothetical protein
MVPVTLPLGEERIGTPKRTFDSIVIKALKTESVIEGVREELWGVLQVCLARRLSWTSVL